MALRELIASFGFDVDKGSEKAALGSVNNIKKAARWAAAASLKSLISLST